MYTSEEGSTPIHTGEERTMATATKARTAKAPDTYRFERLSDTRVAVVKNGLPTYTITLRDGAPVECSCVGFRYRRGCKHLWLVQDAFAPAATETIACGGCGERVPANEAHAHRTDGGTRFFCPACEEDLLAHADEPATIAAGEA
jgi:hypothetical protein